MCYMISCLVGRSGKVYAFDGVHSHSEIAERAKINEDKYLKYEYRIASKELIQDFNMDSTPFKPKQSHDQAAMAFFEECCGTPKKLIAFVKRGNWDENELLPLLNKDSQKKLNSACDAAWKEYYSIRAVALKKYESEKEYSAACTAAEKKYYTVCIDAAREYESIRDVSWKEFESVCAVIWVKLYSKPENRK